MIGVVLTAFGHLESRLALLDAVLPLCRLMIVFESLNWTAYSPYVLYVTKNVSLRCFNTFRS